MKNLFSNILKPALGAFSSCMGFTLSLLLTLFCSFAYAEGESRQNPIKVSGDLTADLLGEADMNTTTWFLVTTDAFSKANLMTLTVTGGNYGDVVCSSTKDDSYNEVVFISAAPTLTLKHYWTENEGELLVTISQDNKGGQVQFSFSKAKEGEVRQLALTAVEGVNNIPMDVASEPWYRYTATSDAMVNISNATILSNVLDEEGRISCPRTLVSDGFRLREGDVVYFQVMATETPFTISLSEVPEGLYADKPLDITGMTQFELAIPNDPNATNDNAAQSERYWLYRAGQNGHLMWGTDDAAWTAGKWGVGVVDKTTGKRLNTPITEEVAGMVTYTISVEAGHEYLIEQTIGHGKGRQVNVYLSFTEAQMGDTRENPILLTLGQLYDMGRQATTTHYYQYTAETEGIYTATIHAGGQVRATTTKDGSWNIGRDYSIQDRQMHIDDNIPLSVGDVLLLEITLTSNVDVHVGGDADVPNYSILITRNGDAPAEEVREGGDIEHAIVAAAGTAYNIWLGNDDDFYVRYYSVEQQAGVALTIETQHDAAISSPSCLSFSLDGGTNWTEGNDLVSSTFLSNEDGKKVGRQYDIQPSDAPRTVYVRVDGVSFLYEGATWRIVKGGGDVVDALQAPVQSHDANIFDLQGRRVARPAKGLYLKAGRKIAF